MIIPPRRSNPRSEHQLRESQRANSSASLAEKFPTLKALTVNLSYFDADGVRKNGELTYQVNVHHARSVFCFVCRNGECVGGDFDLSGALEDAIGGRKKTAEGQIQCRGLRTKAKRNKVPCQNLLRYKLSLSYLPT